MEQLTIRQYLNKYGVLQTTLAKDLKVSDAMVSKWVRNRATVTKEMQKQLTNYFESKDIQIIFTDTQMSRSKLEEKYEKLEKAYDQLQYQFLQLAEENQNLREGMKQIISLGKYLEGIKGRKPRIEKNAKTTRSSL